MSIFGGPLTTAVPLSGEESLVVSNTSPNSPEHGEFSSRNVHTALPPTTSPASDQVEDYEQRELLTQSRSVSADVETDSESREEYHSWRPRYSGPSSTWRTFTAPERQLVSSLDILRSQDLALHLFAAHNLKWQTRAPDKQQIANWASKDRWLSEKRWVPDQAWTAWPMEVDDVPRQPETTSSQGLEETIFGVILRIAKEKFWGRQKKTPVTVESVDSVSEDDIPGFFGLNEEHRHPDTPVVMADDETSRRILRPVVNHLMAQIDEVLFGLHHSSQSYFNQGGEMGSKAFDSEEEGDSSRTHKNKYRNRLSAKRGRQRKRRTSDDPDQYTPKGDQGWTDIESQDINIPLETRSPTFDLAFDASNITPIVYPMSQSRSKEGSKPSSEKPRERSEKGRSPPSKNPRRSYVYMRGRDWSDVLGIATLGVWDQNSIAGASQRCASLFGEGLTLRTLEENPYLPNASKPDSVTQYVPSSVPDIGAMAWSDGSTMATEKALLDAEIPGPVSFRFPCPQADCGKGFSHKHHLTWHMKLVHGETYETPTESPDEMSGAVHVDRYLHPVKRRKGWREKHNRVKLRSTGQGKRKRKFVSDNESSQ